MAPAAPNGANNIRIAFLLNILFTIVEVVGALMTNSLAILSDALHDLGDSLALGLAWYFQKLSSKGRDTRYSYGYRRFSIMGAFVNGLILIVGAVFIIRAAVLRIGHPVETDTKGMFLLALLGIVVNGLAYRRLNRGSGPNERMAALHLLEDVLGWVVVLAGSLVMHFTGWYVLDAILSIGISLFILFNVYKHLSGSLRVILQAVPADVDIVAVHRRLLEVPGVVSAHDLHVWSLDGRENILTVHVVLDNSAVADPVNVKREISAAMASMGMGHCTIETEQEGEDCGFQECAS